MFMLNHLYNPVVVVVAGVIDPVRDAGTSGPDYSSSTFLLESSNPRGPDSRPVS